MMRRRGKWTAWLTLVVLVCAGAADGDKKSGGERKSSKSGDDSPIMQVLPCTEKAEKELLAYAGTGFKARQTPHFVIAYDTDDETLRNFTHRIEVTYKSVAQFAEGMGVKVKVPDAKLEIIFIDSLEAYREFGKRSHFPADDNTPGFYQQGINRSAFFNYANSTSIQQAKQQLRDARNQIKRSAPGRSGLDGNRVANFEANIEKMQNRVNRLVVQHEVAHHVLFNIGLHAVGEANPRWFSEGLAMMFETPPSRSGGAGIGAINQTRLGDWLELESEKKLVSLRELVSKPELILPTNPDAIDAYAQSWALVHYLQRNKRADLVKYIDLIRQRKEERVYSPDEEIATFEKAFGPLDDRFATTQRNFIKRLPYKPSETRG